MFQPQVIVDPKTWVAPPLGAQDGTADEPTTGALVAQVIGWLAVGGVIGAAMWALADEVVGVRRGQR